MVDWHIARLGSNSPDTLRIDSGTCTEPSSATMESSVRFLSSGVANFKATIHLSKADFCSCSALSNAVEGLMKKIQHSWTQPTQIT
jgi:hypothetical protein